MKLPSSVGQKKIKALEQMLLELGVELSPTPTEELVHMFNELRSDLVLLYELKQACANCEYELQMLRHRHEALARAGVLGALPRRPRARPPPRPSQWCLKPVSAPTPARTASSMWWARPSRPTRGSDGVGLQLLFGEESQEAVRGHTGWGAAV